MAIFNSYVKLPEGKQLPFVWSRWCELASKLTSSNFNTNGQSDTTTICQPAELALDHSLEVELVGRC